MSQTRPTALKAVFRMIRTEIGFRGWFSITTLHGSLPIRNGLPILVHSEEGPPDRHEELEAHPI